MSPWNSVLNKKGKELTYFNTEYQYLTAICYTIHLWANVFVIGEPNLMGAVVYSSAWHYTCKIINCKFNLLWFAYTMGSNSFNIRNSFILSDRTRKGVTTYEQNKWGYQLIRIFILMYKCASHTKSSHKLTDSLHCLSFTMQHDSIKT